MKKIIIISTMVLCTLLTYAQHTVTLSVLAKHDREPLAGATATITSLNKTSVADSSGLIIFQGIPAGIYLVNIKYVELEEQEVTIQVPQPEGSIFQVLMEEGEEAEEEVIITATRTSRSIDDIPTRVETISGEELAEKGNMKPSEIRMLLSESTGIQVQQTSATSYNSGIRIQGLDGRYTQILRDGLPMYAGFSGGLSIMQIAPLDLKQVEVIKGSSSTLYGGGAIAGLVNLVSKSPTEKRELDFIVNATTAKGLDLSGFYSEKYKKVGLTIFGSRNSGSAYDPAGTGLTAIPRFERYTLNPRVFIYGKKTNANIGFSYITEDRLGGSMQYIKNGTTGYFERNNTDRFTGQAELRFELGPNSSVQLKSNFSNFKRLITVPAYVFEGVQMSSYSEFSFQAKKEGMFWIAGVNFLTDDLNEQKHSTTILRNYHHNTLGAFLQNTWEQGEKFTLETGMRMDYVKQYGVEFLPRFSAMLKVTPKLTMRLGGGLGYKTPTVFNEDAEKLHFQGILPIDQSSVNNERSIGGNLDVNYRARIGEVGFTINQLFFYTRLNDPLILTPATGSEYKFINARGDIDTKGLETNIRVSFEDFKLFIGYTYSDVNSHFDNRKEWFPLTARHRLNNVLMYEKEEKLKIGLEAYYFSRQKLNDGSVGKAYWICGLMAEKLWEKFSVFVNFENFLDTRQTRFDVIYTGSIQNPVFKDIYAPVDGFVVNGGFKIRL